MNNLFSGITRLRWQRADKAILHTELHPCSIDGNPHLVYAKGLKESRPSLYAAVKRFANKAGYKLCDSLFACLSYNQSVQSEEHQLLLAALNPGNGQQIAGGNKPVHASKAIVTSQDIKNILTDHLSNDHLTLQHLSKELGDLADYYAQFPKVAELITSLENEDWTLKFQSKSHETMLRGSALSVDSATILFDPRSAAQFKFFRSCPQHELFCYTSPADLLLHEFLHAQKALLETKQFLAQGGMSQVMYPFAHEREVIFNERTLYRSMTALDGRPRPLRNEHSGKHRLSKCVTCIR